ncbi:MAG: chorismate mutase [Clostridia bacterium]
MKGIRGAITVDNNTKQNIYSCAQELFLACVKANNLLPNNIVAVIFSSTADITEAYPAYSIRQIEEYKDLAYMCLQEQSVKNSLKLCLRILILAENIDTIKFCYLKGANILREDLQ